MMKNINKILVIVMIVAFIFTGCNNNEVTETLEHENVLEQVDVEELGSYMMDNIEFKDYMSKVDNDIFSSLFNITEGMVENAVLYSSTGATAEEVAIIRATDGNAETVVEACKNRVETQIQGFENYVPEELEKLSEPVIMTFGNTVIFVVCDDRDAVEKLIDNYENVEI